MTPLSTFLRTGSFGICLLFPLLLVPMVHGFNYEVYPGSAFYLSQMLDRSQWSYVAERSNGLYHHETGFTDLTDAQEVTYTSHFTNRFAMVEGSMGGTQTLTTSNVGELQRVIALGLTPTSTFVNQASTSLSLWRQQVRNDAVYGAPSYQMLAPHRIADSPLGWDDPYRDYVRTNMFVTGCIGCGVDAPVYLYRFRDDHYRKTIHDARDWTVANGKRFNYLVSPNVSYNEALLADTLFTVRHLEDNNHEPDVYSVALYGDRPVDLVPEKVNVNGVDQAATTITGLAYYLLKHRDGEPGTLDLSASRSGTDHALGITSARLSNAAQTVSLPTGAPSTWTLNLANSSPWLDYAGVLRARTHGAVADWSITFSVDGADVSAAVLSPRGRKFLGAERWIPGTTRNVTMTATPLVPSPGNFKLILEALPHGMIDHALDTMAFTSGTVSNTPPTLAFEARPSDTNEGVALGPIWFTCGDAETLYPSLTVNATSSNTTLVPNANIAFGQNGIQRWIRIVPAPGQWGTTTITLTVSDGPSSVTQSFVMMVKRTNVQTLVKANNANNLELSNSWQGSVQPSIHDLANWNSTVTGPNSVNTDNPVGLSGIRITNPGGDVTIGGTSPLTLGLSGVNLSSTTRNLFLNGPVLLEEYGTWNIAANRLVRLTQGAGGVGTIVKSGDGRLELLGNDSFNGGLFLTAGEVVKTGAGNQKHTSISNNASLRVSHSGGFGTGGLAISSANTQTGRVILSGGISVLGGESISINSRNSDTDAIISASGNNTLGGIVEVGPGGSRCSFSSEADLFTFAARLQAAASGNRNYTFRGAGEGSITGRVANGDGIVGIIKSGTGRWTISRTQSFTGPVSIQQGTFRILTPLATQPVTTSAEATLSGTGTLGGVVIMAGIHSPGDPVGRQIIQGPLTYGATSSIRFELSGQSTTADLVQAASVTVAPGARIDPVTTAVDFLHTYWRQPRQWPVLTTTSLTGSFALGTETLLDSFGRPSQPFGNFSLAHTATAVNLVWTPAPPFQVWQYENFGDSWNNPLIAGPNADPDGDAWSNLNEWISGNLPNDPNSRFTTAISPAGITFLRSAGRSYRIERSTQLNGSWTLHATVPNGTGTFTIPVTPGSGGRTFYRVAITF
jgi:autotransporter-associated beta strand protein